MREGSATALPVDDGEFDAALSVHVQEYVPEIEQSLTEAYRVLRPGGRVLIWDVDWRTLSMSGEPQRTERVARAWDEHLVHPSLPPVLATRLREAGFGDVRMSAHAFATIELDRDSYGAVLVPFIAKFVAGRQGISEDDANAWVAEQRVLADRGEFFFAVTQFCFTAVKPA